jgi:hypothetical protein
VACFLSTAIGWASITVSVDAVGIGVLPALALVLQRVCGLLSYFASEVALDDPDREIDPGRKPARAGKVANFNEPGSV